jgi:hypothetical protein
VVCANCHRKIHAGMRWDGQGWDSA